MNNEMNFKIFSLFNLFFNVVLLALISIPFTVLGIEKNGFDISDYVIVDYQEEMKSLSQYNIEDPYGTKYFRYRFLTDSQKAVYWGINKVLNQNQDIIIVNIADCGEGDVDAALYALTCDNPIATLYCTDFTRAKKSVYQNADCLILNREWHYSNNKIALIEKNANMFVSKIDDNKSRYNRFANIIELINKVTVQYPQLLLASVSF